MFTSSRLPLVPRSTLRCSASAGLLPSNLHVTPQLRHQDPDPLLSSFRLPDGTDTYGYDASGSQTSRTEAGEAYTQTVNAEGQLVSVQNTISGETWTFTYDGDPTPLRFGDDVASA